MAQYSRQPGKSYHSARSSLKIGKDTVRKDDIILTLLEKDHILLKYNIDKTEMKSSIENIKGEHISMNDVIDLLKKWNISKQDEDVLVKDLSKFSRKKYGKK